MQRRSAIVLPILIPVLIAVVMWRSLDSGPPESAAQLPPVTGEETLPANHPPLDHAMTPDHPPLADDAPPHPHGTSKEPPVVVPQSVQQRWAAVTLAVTPAGGAAQELRVAIGGEVAVPGSDLVVKLPAFLPSYMSDVSSITSVSDELNNPAVRVEAWQGGALIAVGWVFMNFPDFDSFNSDQLQLRLISAEARGN